MYTGHQTRTQCHVPAHVTFLAQCSIACLVSVSHMHNMCMWLKASRLKSQWSVVFAKTFSSHLAQHGTQHTFSDDSAIAEHFRASHLHSNPHFRPSTRPSTGPLQISSSDEIYHCDDPVNVSFGSLADLHSPSGYEPKDLAEEDNPVQVKPLFFHRPSMTSTYDSAESIATSPPEWDLDDEQIRTLLASSLYLQEREASADRSRVYHSFRENSASSSSHFRESTGKPVARESTGNPLRCFQTKGSRVKKHLPTELAEAKFEVRKQECRADFLDSSVRDLQRQLDSNRLEINCTNQGYEESRKEQARLHEELAHQKRLLRETQIRSVHEVRELKSAQELRIDEFSGNELRESHATILELTSQVQEVQERMNYMNGS